MTERHCVRNFPFIRWWHIGFFNFSQHIYIIIVYEKIGKLYHFCLKFYFCQWYWQHFSYFNIMFNNIGRYCCMFLVNYIIRLRFFSYEKPYPYWHIYQKVLYYLILRHFLILLRVKLVVFFQVIWNLSDTCDKLFFYYYTCWFEVRYIFVFIRSFNNIYDNLWVWS